MFFEREKSLNKKRFDAGLWFQSNEPKSMHTSFTKQDEKLNAPSFEQNSPLAPFQSSKPTNPLEQFFVPGWKGESLFSKNRKIFSDTLSILAKDVSQFLIKNSLPRKLQVSIYNEFLAFSEFKALNCTLLDNYSTFWVELKAEKGSKFYPEIHSFLSVFSLRVATIYLLKVRFILTLKNKMNEKFNLNHIMYPNSFFTRTFKTASSTELFSKAFESNIFSWYRPKEELQNLILKYKEISNELTISEIIKTVSITTEELLNNKSDYSHSLSHQSFGLFLNSILINFPIWLESIKRGPKQNFYNKQTSLDIISTKFTGDHLESLSVSHWLAQYANRSVKWEQILCPDFKKDQFDTGFYLIILNELQFLNFLAEISNEQGHEPKTFISNIINGHLFNRKETGNLQKSLMVNGNELNSSTYDRVVVNLTQFPKNNPQPFLFNKITTQVETLKDNGLLFVLTSKKLFVPSQKGKIDSLLKELKLEGIFNFEEVHGKGEIGSFIYIFSKKSNESDFSQLDKQACLNFRFSANLNTFQEFSFLTSLGQDFFKDNLNDVPPLYQKVKNECRLEFFQDAIVNGQLIHSSTKDSTNVTHPLFFQKLLQLCNPLDYFFDIQHVDFEETNQEEDNSLFNFSQSFKREKSSTVIIVDKRIKEEIKLEFVSSKVLEAKAYEYGHTQCSYFYAYPKWPNLDVNSVKEFFLTNIGRQVISLTFSNEVRKTKGNLGKLLIPKYFISKKEIPVHLLSGLKLFYLSADELLTVHPSDIERSYKQISNILPSLVRNYPAQTLSLLSNFKSSLATALIKFDLGQKQSVINFNNPLLKSPLILSKTYPIYPDNEDVYLEFHNQAMNQIHASLTSVRKAKQEKEGQIIYSLDIYAEEEKVLSLYSDEILIQFLDFIFQKCIGHPISKVLQSIAVPSLEDLQSIVSSFKLLERTLTDTAKGLEAEFNKLIGQTIFQN